MKKVQHFILQGQEIFVGLEDSRKTWKVCVRSGKAVVHRVSMEARYEVLRNYLCNKFPRCKVTVMYEAGFRGLPFYRKG